jgi:hypothetical protein
MNGQSAIKSPKHAALPAQAKVKNVLDDRISAASDFSVKQILEALSIIALLASLSPANYAMTSTKCPHRGVTDLAKRKTF